jgi:hypothetical protein
VYPRSNTFSSLLSSLHACASFFKPGVAPVATSALLQQLAVMAHARLQLLLTFPDATI